MNHAYYLQTVECGPGADLSQGGVRQRPGELRRIASMSRIPSSLLRLVDWSRFSRWRDLHLARDSNRARESNQGQQAGDSTKSDHKSFGMRNETDHSGTGEDPGVAERRDERDIAPERPSRFRSEGED